MLDLAHLGGLPEPMRSEAWKQVYKRTALGGVLAGVGGGLIGYAVSSSRHKARGAWLGGLGVSGATVGALLIMGWRRIKQADEAYDTWAKVGGYFTDIFNPSKEG